MGARWRMGRRCRGEAGDDRGDRALRGEQEERVGFDCLFIEAASAVLKTDNSRKPDAA